MPPLPKRPNKGISDAQKKALRVFVADTRPRPSQRACVEWFNSKFDRLIDRATVSKILSSKYDYLDTGLASIQTRPSISQWPILDQALFEWQQQHQDTTGFPITGPLLRLKAIEFWKKIPQYQNLPLPLFSDGWLTRFKKRHHLRYRSFHGEAASVPMSVHEDMKALRTVCNRYQKEDIYNMDETGLFWRRMPNGGLSTQNLAGRKQDKTRITIVVATNATGSDRIPLWLIGTAKTPRTLRKVNTRAIGCVWRWNKKAWMRGNIMAEWLHAFYKHIGKQRRVLLLMDNFKAHLSALDFAPPPSNIKVLFFPANATSVYQPLDQGIIQNLKHHYRKKWITWMINMIDRGINPGEKMSLYYTLNWITQAWRNNVLDRTIQNCFEKSTIICPSSDQIEPESLELTPLYQSLIERFPSSGEQEVISLNEFLNPSDENNIAEPDLSDIIADFSDDGDSTQDDEYISGPPVDVPSSTEAINGIQNAIIWAQHQEGTTEQDIRLLEDIERVFTRLQTDGKKQRTLYDCWTP